MTNNKSKSRLGIKNVLNNLDSKLTQVFLPWALRHPRYLRNANRFISAYKNSKKLRENALSNGLIVPPFLILSITRQCNLHCVGCFASTVGITSNENFKFENKKRNELNWEEWRRIIDEASELGVGHFVLAGGEPFMFPRLIDLCQEFKDKIFLIVTNGTAMTEDDFKKLKRTTNIVIIISIEGDIKTTNERRGHGVYEQALKTIRRVHKLGVIIGISVTITRMNYKYWMQPKQLDDFIAMGIRIGVFTEYIPSTPVSEIVPENERQLSHNEDHALMLNNEERKEFRKQILKYRKTKRIYLIHTPGDEDLFGGCASAGRGFAHITPRGDLTPCPVSNIATHNLTTSSLSDGLASKLFKEIRENKHLLETEGTPCALFAHPYEVNKLAKDVGAYRADINN